MRSRTNACAMLTSALALLLACAACTNNADGNTSALAAPAATDAAAPKLIDTSSILFPLHPSYEAGIEKLRLNFWMHLQQLDPTPMTTSKVAEIHLGPGSRYEIVTLLKPGVTVEVNGLVGPWYRIADAGGYISALDLAGAFPEGFVWATTVVNKGSDDAADACLGGLTDFTAISEDIGRPFYTMHSSCGGELISELQVGDRILIDASAFEVTSVNDRALFGDSTMVKDIPGDALLHTCNLVTDESRIVSLVATER